MRFLLARARQAGASAVFLAAVVVFVAQNTNPCIAFDIKQKTKTQNEVILEYVGISHKAEEKWRVRGKRPPWGAGILKKSADWDGGEVVGLASIRRSDDAVWQAIPASLGRIDCWRIVVALDRWYLMKNFQDTSGSATVIDNAPLEEPETYRASADGESRCVDFDENEGRLQFAKGAFSDKGASAGGSQQTDGRHAQNRSENGYPQREESSGIIHRPLPPGFAYAAFILFGIVLGGGLALAWQRGWLQ
jgi:hypothetical protein